LDAELEAKRKASYDPKLESEAKQFIEKTTGESLSSDFHEVLLFAHVKHFSFDIDSRH
jgi:hypothetical protein